MYLVIDILSRDVVSDLTARIFAPWCKMRANICAWASRATIGLHNVLCGFKNIIFIKFLRLRKRRIAFHFSTRKKTERVLNDSVYNDENCNFLGDAFWGGEHKAAALLQDLLDLNKSVRFPRLAISSPRAETSFVSMVCGSLGVPVISNGLIYYESN